MKWIRTRRIGEFRSICESRDLIFMWSSEPYLKIETTYQCYLANKDHRLNIEAGACSACCTIQAHHLQDITYLLIAISRGHSAIYSGAKEYDNFKI